VFGQVQAAAARSPEEHRAGVTRERRGVRVHAEVRRVGPLVVVDRVALQGADGGSVAADAAGGEVAGDGEVEWELAADDFADERDALERAAAAYLDYRIGTRSLDAADPLVEGVLAARRFFEALEGAGPGFARSVAFARGAPSLRLHCLEPGRRLARLFARCRTVVAVSATLRPFEARRALLGLDEDRTDALALPSPFPPARRAVVIDPRADTRLRTRAREAPRLARRLAAFASAVPGAVLVLAPSFAWLEAVRAALPPLDRAVLAQQADDGARERERLLAALAAPANPPVLLLAVAGGFFGEGVDWPGALAGVAVLGPCLPPPDLPRELLRRAYDDRFGAGFDLAYALPGMTRVVQGAGRLIRSERDRGVIALFGRRFLEPPYRELLPSEWLGGGAPEDLVGDPARVARGFFAQPA
jgi:DNA excision repair protein ERCC-2